MSCQNLKDTWLKALKWIVLQSIFTFIKNSIFAPMLPQRCGYCGFWGEMIFVHSHYQCPQCKNNISPCCEGEQCLTEEEQKIEPKKTKKIGHKD